MSALILIAFSNEAHANLIGSESFGADWDEGARTEDKLHKLVDHFTLDDRKTLQALEAAKGLIKLRNALAHPKSGTQKINKAFRNYPTEQQLRSLEAPPLLRRMTEKEVEHQYRSMNHLYQVWCEAAGLNQMELNPGASYEIKRTDI